jgi:flagellar basal body-associated protein FliL
MKSKKRKQLIIIVLTVVVILAVVVGGGAFRLFKRKNVAIWLEIHQAGIEGRCASVSDQKIALQIQGIRDFITRNPA